MKNAYNFVKITRFQCSNLTVDFIPYKGAPGFTHKVVLSIANKVAAKDWLPVEEKPTDARANAFAQKHASALTRAGFGA